MPRASRKSTAIVPAAAAALEPTLQPIVLPAEAAESLAKMFDQIEAERAELQRRIDVVALAQQAFAAHMALAAGKTDLSGYTYERSRHVLIPTPAES
jgi:hypothetical protein